MQRIEPFVPYAEAAGNVAALALEQGATVFGLGAVVGLLKGVIAVSTGSNKLVYAETLQKLQRLQDRLQVLDTELVSQGLCVNEQSLTADVIRLARYLTEKRNLKTFVSLFNSKLVADEIESLVSKVLFSYDILLTDVALLLVYLMNETSGKPNTPLLESFVATYKGSCVRRL